MRQEVSGNIDKILAQSRIFIDIPICRAIAEMEDVINRKRESEEKSMSKEVISNEFLYSVKKKSVWSNGIWNECRRRGSPADLFYDCCYHDFF